MIRTYTSLIALALLTACGGDPAPAPETTEGGVAGDVLEGSISDEMIPLSELRSQSPTLGDSSGSNSDGDQAAEEDAAGE